MSTSAAIADSLLRQAFGEPASRAARFRHEPSVESNMGADLAPPRRWIEARRLAAWDLPCCPVCCADVPRPLPRRGNLGSSVRCSPRLQRPSRLFRPVDPRDFTFEACSAFTPVAARRLADPPTVGLCPKSFDQSVAFLAVLVATGVSRQLPRQDVHR